MVAVCVHIRGGLFEVLLVLFFLLAPLDVEAFLELRKCQIIGRDAVLVANLLMDVLAVVVFEHVFVLFHEVILPLAIDALVAVQAQMVGVRILYWLQSNLGIVGHLFVAQWRHVAGRYLVIHLRVALVRVHIVAVVLRHSPCLLATSPDSGGLLLEFADRRLLVQHAVLLNVW